MVLQRKVRLGSEWQWFENSWKLKDTSPTAHSLFKNCKYPNTKCKTPIKIQHMLPSVNCRIAIVTLAPANKAQGFVTWKKCSSLDLNAGYVGVMRSQEQSRNCQNWFISSCFSITVIMWNGFESWFPSCYSAVHLEGKFLELFDRRQTYNAVFRLNSELFSVSCVTQIS